MQGKGSDSWFQFKVDNLSLCNACWYSCILKCTDWKG